MDLSKNRQKLNTFFKSHTRLQYKKGETIIRPEDEPGGIFLIEWGFVKASNLTKYGEENLLIARGAGAVFPMIWAFSGEHRSISYEAMEPTSLWRVSKSDYLAFLESNPEIVPVILGMAVDAYHDHSNRVMTLCYRTARERIVSFLLGCIKNFGIKNEDGSVTVEIPYKQSDIASSVNATRETASRELNALKKKGLIGTIGGHITILDQDKLREML